MASFRLSIIIHSIPPFVAVAYIHVGGINTTSNHEPGMCFVKSKRLAIERVLDSSLEEESFRLSRLLLALTPGPVEFISAFPSTSSRGRPLNCILHLGSLEGCVGYGRLVK